MQPTPPHPMQGNAIVSTKETAPVRPRVLRILLTTPLSELTAIKVADQLGMSESTLRRRLRAEHTSYRKLLEEVRRHRCYKALTRRRVGGKFLAEELGFQQINSFYRAFTHWTGTSWGQYKRESRKKLFFSIAR